MTQVSAPVELDDLVRRVDDGWREFRAAVRSLGRAGLERATSAGWTYKDLVAHVAAWEAWAPGRLDAIRAGTAKPMSDEDVDAFNARVVEGRRQVSAEAILDELDAAHRRLVESIRRLTLEELASQRLVNTVVGNTFGHYADHAEELGL